MTWLITKNRKKEYRLYCPDVYGMETWGGNAQESIEKKNKYWYICVWRSGGELCDDYNESIKLNVVCESTNIGDILRYLYNHKCKKDNIKKILDDAKEMFNQYIGYQQWALDDY